MTHPLFQNGATTSQPFIFYKQFLHMDFFSLLERLSQVMMQPNSIVIGCPNLIAQSKRDVKTIALSIGALLKLLDLYGPS